MNTKVRNIPLSTDAKTNLSSYMHVVKNNPVTVGCYIFKQPTLKVKDIHKQDATTIVCVLSLIHI